MGESEFSELLIKPEKDNLNRKKLFKRFFFVITITAIEHKLIPRPSKYHCCNIGFNLVKNTNLQEILFQYGFILPTRKIKMSAN